MSAYETWCRTKNNLVEEPDSEYLQQVEQNLREPALKDFLAMFAGELYDRYDEVTREPTAAEVQHFLINLDLLRAPNSAELDAMRAGLILNADSTLQAMKRLNYTGDHTHTEVLDDVRQVLKAVLQGRPMPKLERFRCPSLRKVGKIEFRCDLQLPHGEEHLHSEPSNGMGARLRWTDEESLNPPVPYETPKPEPRCTHRFNELHCERAEGHDDKHRAESGENMFLWSDDLSTYRGVSAATIREAEAMLEEQNRCESRWHTNRCMLRRGHDGKHETPDRVWWGTEHETCSEQMPNTLAVTVCGRPPGHKGMHSSLTGGTWPQ